MYRSITGLILILASLGAHAALLSRASGQAYYDTVLNITWVADADLSQTSGYDADGLMTWSGAQTWIGSLNTASYLGVSDWRLPSADVNADTTIVNCSTATEPNCRDNEMGYMYWRNAVTSSSPSPFTNVRPFYYWSGTEYAPFTSYAWHFFFSSPGFNSFDPKDSTTYAWAVRPGDIVPVPAAVWLLGSALGVLGWMRQRVTRA